MTSLDVKTAAERVARAEQQLADAEGRRTVAAAKVVQLRERLAAVTARRTHIRERLAAGELSDREGGGLLGLADEDAADLRALLDQAAAEEAAAAPVREQQDLVGAQAALQQAVAAAKVDAVREYLKHAEEALLAALGRGGELLREAGLPVGLQILWQPSNHTVRAVAQRVLPPPSAPGMGG